VYAPNIEHVPPDVTAGIFWMKNRDGMLSGLTANMSIIAFVGDKRIREFEGVAQKDALMSELINEFRDKLAAIAPMASGLTMRCLASSASAIRVFTVTAARRARRGRDLRL
jgi:hypothetical protein